MVIAIIAILAAILFPVFAKARENARKTACLSNGKQVGAALMMYIQDYDEMMPFIMSCGAPAQMRHAAMVPQGQLHPYVKNTNVWECPSARRGTGPLIDQGAWSSDASNLWRFPREFVGRTISIGCNGPIFKNLGCGVTDKPLSYASIKEPARVMAFADSAVFATCGCLRMIFPDACCAERDRPQDAVEGNTRHNGGSNIIYCDGHSKWVNYRTLLAEKAGSKKLWWP